jgi:DMSO/TMAO reductase YedYZ molybdopterin-dependent catalytic subunit
VDTRGLSRRDLLLMGSTALAASAFFRLDRLVAAAPLQQGEEILRWADQPPPEPPPGTRNQLVWEDLDSWVTPNERFFRVVNYQGYGPLGPALDAQAWRLEITGLVSRTLTFTLDELKARPRQDVTFTVECGGNNGIPGIQGLVGNATWAGTPLAPLLQEAGVLEKGIEVVFWGSDIGEEVIREIPLKMNFGRSMSVADAMSPDLLLAYEMNGEPLPRPQGFPVRLIVPGWYGVANVKWLKRIEVWDTRFMNRFMARDYVTIREEQRDGETVAIETSVNRSLLKSAPARVTRLGSQYKIQGAAWGGQVTRAEVQIDGGPWMPTTLVEGEGATYGWKFWVLEWGSPPSGEHTITSRAIDAAGNIQPAMDDPRIATKRTRWESNGQITRRILIA